MSSPHRIVRKRRVFYVPGYDPVHPRRYRELYRKEGADQAAISGYDIALEQARTKGRYGWHVSAGIDGHQTEADFEVMVWSDIVRGSMQPGILATYLLLVRTAWAYIASGALWRLMKLPIGPVIAALYPVVFLLVQLMLALLLCGLVVWAGTRLLPGVPGLAFWAVGLALGYGVLRWFRARDNKFFAYYLMHDYAYSARSMGANPPDLEARITEFTTELAEALTQDLDEVLVVGHSSGAHLAVSVLADLIRAGRVPEGGPALGLLTLGQVVPMVSFLPKARRLRRDLHDLCQRPELTWIDVTAPGDGCTFALCDPVAVSGVAPASGRRLPLVISAAFTKTLSEAKWAEIKRRYFRLHFQYMCAFDRPGDYDYFQITAGPQTLAQRFEGRNPSPSRIDRAVSKYTDMAP